MQKPSSLAVHRLNCCHMQGRNSQRELRKQLSEKCTSTVQNIVKIARSVREESGSEVWAVTYQWACGMACDDKLSISTTHAGCGRLSTKICRKGEVYIAFPSGKDLSVARAAGYCINMKLLQDRYDHHMHMQAAEQLPHQLVQLDLHLSVVHHHLSNLADSARRVATADDSVT